MTIEIPDKLYFKIGEVSKLADVAPHVLRYWESEFSDIKPKRAGSKQRLYRREDVELILVIKNLLHGQGYTISGAKKILDESSNIIDFTMSEPPPEGAAEKLDSIKKELLELKQFLSDRKEH